MQSQDEKEGEQCAPEIIAYVRGGGRMVLAYLIKSKQQFESATLLLVMLRVVIWEISAYMLARGFQELELPCLPPFFDSSTDIFRESQERWLQCFLVSGFQRGKNSRPSMTPCPCSTATQLVFSSCLLPSY